MLTTPTQTPLRRKDKAMPPAEAWAFLRAAPLVHFASTTPNDSVVLRALHPIFLPGVTDRIFFHGSALGERGECVGRRGAVSAEVIHAEIPSTATGPERACPATTFFTSVSASGSVVEIDDDTTKASVLQALMERFQAEGGYVPIEVESERGQHLYRNAVRSISVVALVIDQLTGKRALGQGKSDGVRHKICQTLWERGRPADAAAVDAIVDAAPPEAVLPPLAIGPNGVRFRFAPTERHAHEAAHLLKDTYWNRPFDVDTLRRAHLSPQAWIVGTLEGAVVCTARALTDGAKRGLILDVAVAPHLRGQRLGTRLMERLLDHPALRQVQAIELGTRDAMGFYAQFGFSPAPTTHTRMTRLSHEIREKPNNFAAQFATAESRFLDDQSAPKR